MTNSNDSIVVDITGKGCRFPNIFSKKTGGVAVRSGIEKVNQSIADILNTRIGERVLQPNYGSRIHELIFDINDEAMHDLLRMRVMEAIENWEPRIVVENIKVIMNDDNIHQADIEISYVVKRSNLRGIYVYPFVSEASELEGLGG